jgi:hypothetical protein
MKPLFLTLLTLLTINSSFESFSIVKPAETSVEKPVKKVGIDAIGNLSITDYEKLIGKKPGFIQRLGFNIGKKHVKNQLKQIGNQTIGFNLKGFLLGFLIPFYGVIIAYIFSKDRNFRKWA